MRDEFLFPNEFCTQTKKGFKMKVLWHRYKHGYKCAFYTFRSCSLGGEFYIGMFNLTAPAEVHLVTSESYSSVNKEIIYQPFSIRIIGP